MTLANHLLLSKALTRIRHMIMNLARVSLAFSITTWPGWNRSRATPAWCGRYSRKYAILSLSWPGNGRSASSRGRHWLVRSGRFRRLALLAAWLPVPRQQFIDRFRGTLSRSVVLVVNSRGTQDLEIQLSTAQALVVEPDPLDNRLCLVKVTMPCDTLQPAPSR
jgi:hypothetical protein